MNRLPPDHDAALVTAHPCSATSPCLCAPPRPHTKCTGKTTQGANRHICRRLVEANDDRTYESNGHWGYRSIQAINGLKMT